MNTSRVVQELININDNLSGAVSIVGTSNINHHEVGGSAIQVGNGSETGCQRVCIASDNLDIPVSLEANNLTDPIDVSCNIPGIIDVSVNNLVQSYITNSSLPLSIDELTISDVCFNLPSGQTEDLNTNITNSLLDVSANITNLVDVSANITNSQIDVRIIDICWNPVGGDQTQLLQIEDMDYVVDNKLYTYNLAKGVLAYGYDDNDKTRALKLNSNNFSLYTHPTNDLSCNIINTPIDISDNELIPIGGST
ncbi:MAG: hypothetical protein GY756_22800, partial [bacterium]|nr:hypothetical protein [bacterium]